MKISLMVLGLALGTNAMADSNSDCVNKIVEFYGLKENTTKELNGMNNGKKCELNVEYRKMISGLNNKESNTVFFYLNVESEDGNMMKGVWSEISSNEDDRSYSVSKCEVKDNQLVINFKSKEKNGWKKHYRTEIVSSDKSVSIKEKVSGFWVSSFKESQNCQF